MRHLTVTFPRESTKKTLLSVLNSLPLTRKSFRVALKFKVVRVACERESLLSL